MAPLETHVAHCGACAGIMVLRRDYRPIYWLYWYICQTCGTETQPCLTIAEADQDVVWVPLAPKDRKSD
jgi:hypothetical protein